MNKSLGLLALCLAGLLACWQFAGNLRKRERQRWSLKVSVCRLMGPKTKNAYDSNCSWASFSFDVATYKDAPDLGSVAKELAKSGVRWVKSPWDGCEQTYVGKNEWYHCGLLVKGVKL